jgi:hypothetical protein
MSLFSDFKLDLAKAEQELTSFRAWLAQERWAAEKRIVAEIRSRPNMIGLLGPTAAIPAPDLIRWELELGGVFRTDLVIGNNAHRAFGLIEFEGANETSIFSKKRTAQYRYWSAEIEHGFSQVIDWAYFEADKPGDAALHDNFGGPIKKSTYLVICGRDHGIDGKLEDGRFSFRRRYVQIQGIQASIYTYDQMAAGMADNLEAWKTV